VEPSNTALAQYTGACVARRETGQPTLPSSIAIERAINPFLRCTEPAVVRAAQAEGAQGTDAVSVLAALREWKNRFR
jgi:hydroxyacylglutathione hydrolase